MKNLKNESQEGAPETVSLYISASVLKGMPHPRFPDPRELYKKFIAEKFKLRPKVITTSETKSGKPRT